jgi:two-component sensor histidine kinase
LFSTLIGGYKVGIFASVISTVISWYVFMPPVFSFSFADRGTNVNVLLFLVCSALTVWIAGGYRQLVASMKEADEHRALLFEEMQHRAKNCISVTRVIVENTLKSETEKAERVMGRLQTVLSYDQVFLDRNQAGERLRDIVVEQIKPYDEARFMLKGGDIVITPQNARCWALIIHELATNAAKYGALSRPDGSVRIAWAKDADELALSWIESGVRDDSARDASTPTSGFGTKLIHAMVRGLDGRIESHFTDDGLHCTIRSKVVEV